MKIRSLGLVVLVLVTLNGCDGIPKDVWIAVSNTMQQCVNAGYEKLEIEIGSLKEVKLDIESPSIGIKGNGTLKFSCVGAPSKSIQRSPASIEPPPLLLNVKDGKITLDQSMGNSEE